MNPCFVQTFNAMSLCLSTWSVQTWQQGWSEVWVSQAGYDLSAWKSDGFKRKWQKTWKAGRRGWKIMLTVSSDIADRVQQMKPSGTNSGQTCTAVPHTNWGDLSQTMPWKCLCAQDGVGEQMYVEWSLPSTARQTVYIKVWKSPGLKTVGGGKLLGESRRGMRRREWRLRLSPCLWVTATVGLERLQ